jgi:aminoglycoside/choline kinase family phosphotransferase
MKIFKKNFINEITNEIGAAINVERYLSVNYLLQKAKVKTPKILSYDKSSVTLEFIELQHAKINPDFDAFHFSTFDYYRQFDIEKAEFRLQFVDNLSLDKTTRSKIKNIALDNLDWVLKNEPFVFLHMDAIYKNYFLDNSRTIWIDFQDAMMGPKSYDEIHFLIDCFEKTNFDIDSLNCYQQKSAVYNTIRQHAIFCSIPQFKSCFECVTKYNVNKVLKGLDYDLEIT